MSEIRGRSKPGYFTIVFKGKLSAIKSNPFRLESPFGLPEIISMGNLAEECDLLEELLEKKDDEDEWAAGR